MDRRAWTLTGLVPLCAAVAVAAPVRDGGDPAATVTALEGDASFEQTNSRDGMPVLTAAEIGPGDSVAGSVTIANSGTLGGAFSLSARDVVDAPGDGGGVLSERLRLAVRDLAAASPAYDGPLTAADGVPLGYFAPGDVHTYAVSATLPHGPADNAYAGAATSVRLVWDAVEAEPPPDGPTVPDGTDPSGDGDRHAEPTAPPRGSIRTPVAVERPLRLRVRVPRVQRAPLDQHVTIRVHCDRACRIVARGTVQVGKRRAALRPRRTRNPRGGTMSARIALPRTLRPAVRRALARRQPIVVRLTVAARHRDGRRAVVRRRLVVHPTRHGHSARIVTRPLAGVR